MGRFEAAFRFIRLYFREQVLKRGFVPNERDCEAVYAVRDMMREPGIEHDEQTWTTVNRWIATIEAVRREETRRKLLGG